MLHTALYAGVPNSNHGFALLDAAVSDLTESTRVDREEGN
jgi:4-carboxymuconolactone decarboxylase